MADRSNKTLRKQRPNFPLLQRRLLQGSSEQTGWLRLSTKENVLISPSPSFLLI